MNTYKNKWSAFSIIEVLIGIFVFSLGLVSIYALLASSLRISDYNNNAIIASNLAREQVELFRNIRDTNYKKLQLWNQIEPQTGDFWNTFNPDTYYTLENKVAQEGIDVQVLWLAITESQEDVLTMQSEYGLCMTQEGVYTYDCTGWNVSTPFMRYLYIEELETGSYQINSKVIWYKRGYYEYEINTIVTDWRRI